MSGTALVLRRVTRLNELHVSSQFYRVGLNDLDETSLNNPA